MEFKRLREERNRLECLKNRNELTDEGLELIAEIDQALQLNKTQVSGSYNEDSDFDKLKKVFDEIGVSYIEKNTIEEFKTETHTVDYNKTVTYDKFLELDNGAGYYSFECDFYFLDGKYQNHGVWE